MNFHLATKRTLAASVVALLTIASSAVAQSSQTTTTPSTSSPTSTSTDNAGPGSEQTVTTQTTTPAPPSIQALPDPGTLPGGSLTNRFMYWGKRHVREPLTLVTIRNPEQRALREEEYAKRRAAEAFRALELGAPIQVVQHTLQDYRQLIDQAANRIDDRVTSGDFNAEAIAELAERAKDDVAITTDIVAAAPEDVQSEIKDDAENIVLASGTLRDAAIDAKGETPVTAEMSEELLKLRAGGFLTADEFEQLSKSTSRIEYRRTMNELHDAGKIPALEIYRQLDAPHFANDRERQAGFQNFIAGEQLAYLKNTTALTLIEQPNASQQQRIADFFANRSKDPTAAPPEDIAKFVRPQLYLGNLAPDMAKSFAQVDGKSFGNEGDRKVFEELKGKYGNFNPADAAATGRFVQDAFSTIQQKALSGEIKFGGNAAPPGYRPEEFRGLIDQNFQRPGAFENLQTRFKDGTTPSGTSPASGSTAQGQPFQLGAPPAWVKFDQVGSRPFDPKIEEVLRKKGDQFRSETEKNFTPEQRGERRGEFEKFEQEKKAKIQDENQRFKQLNDKFDQQVKTGTYPQPYASGGNSNTQTYTPPTQTPTNNQTYSQPPVQGQGEGTPQYNPNPTPGYTPPSSGSNQSTPTYTPPTTTNPTPSGSTTPPPSSGTTGGTTTGGTSGTTTGTTAGTTGGTTGGTSSTTGGTTGTTTTGGGTTGGTSTTTGGGTTGGTQ